MTWLKRIRIRWQILGYWLLCTGIVHIVATFVPAYFSTNGAYARLSEGLPHNSFVVLPAARPGAQVIPYQIPETLYAICKFDTRRGPVGLNVILAGAGWTLSIYTRDGVSVYDAPGRSQLATPVNLLLVPPGGYFLGVSDAVSDTGTGFTQVQLPDPQGIVVLRAPLGGIAYAHDTERIIRQSKCASKPFSTRTGF